MLDFQKGGFGYKTGLVSSSHQDCDGPSKGISGQELSGDSPSAPAANVIFNTRQSADPCSRTVAEAPFTKP